MGLATYRRKRDFAVTAEPPGVLARKSGNSYLIQKHAASRLHYDFRLEHGGVLWSWAVPKGPPTKPGDKRLAVHVEDHPVGYGTFEGVIPKGQYGGGTVMLWDRGTWKPLEDPVRGMRRGNLSFELAGERLRGRWTLTRMQGRAGEDGDNWLLVKRTDRAGVKSARMPDDQSIASARTMAQIARAGDRVWSSKSGEVAVRKRAPRSAKAPPVRAKRARRAPFPRAVSPQLATLVSTIPTGPEWLHEFKFDGYRLLASLQRGRVRLVTRGGLDWSDRFPTVRSALERLGAQSALIDGEVTVLTPAGKSDFQALQNSLERGAAGGHVFFAFDLLYRDGFDLRASPLIERKEQLAELLAASDVAPVVRYSEHVREHAAEFHARVCRAGLEGAVSKRIDSPYVSARTSDWVKVKCARRQEFVVGGWSEPAGSRNYFGALLLGVYDGARFVYSGRVGAGFDERTLASLAERLAKLATSKPPFDVPPRGADARGAHWVKPKLVVEVTFQEWTTDGRLRHPVFLGVRTDKPAREITRERVRVLEPRGAIKSERRARAAPAIKLTNPDRVLYPDLGLTKRDLANYYAATSEWLLPHVVDRPLSLVRCPEGIAGERFFQKHVPKGFADLFGSVRVPESDGFDHYVTVRDERELVTLAQLNVLEIHPWGSQNDAPLKPDRIVFDLDPDAAVAWKLVVESARTLRGILERLGLASFVRTTGGKGLHVVVPIERRATWAAVKTFARDVSATLARGVPELFLLKASKAARKGKIFVDYLRNDRGSTAIASYSPRAREGAPIAWPMRWDELGDSTDPEKFTIPSASKLLARRRDPWDGFFALAQPLPKR